MGSRERRASLLANDSVQWFRQRVFDFFLVVTFMLGAAVANTPIAGAKDPACTSVQDGEICLHVESNDGTVSRFTLSRSKSEGEICDYMAGFVVRNIDTGEKEWEGFSSQELGCNQYPPAERSVNLEQERGRFSPRSRVCGYWYEREGDKIKQIGSHCEPIPGGTPPSSPASLSASPIHLASSIL